MITHPGVRIRAKGLCQGPGKRGLSGARRPREHNGRQAAAAFPGPAGVQDQGNGELKILWPGSIPPRPAGSNFLL